MTRVARWLGVAFCLWSAAGAQARPAGAGERCWARLRLDGEYRLNVTGLSDFPLDSSGYLHGQRVYGEQRLRLGSWLFLGERVALVAEADVFAGLVFGDVTPVGRGVLSWPLDERDAFRRALLRQAYLAWRSPAGTLTVGQTGAHWGLGLLQNDGRGDVAGALFGDVWRGDLVERVRFVMQPGTWGAGASLARRFSLGLGLDWVFRDERADALAGDKALQTLATLLYRAERLQAGLLFAYRHQWYADGGRLALYSLDGLFTLRHDWRAAGLSLDVAFEGAAVIGTTSRAGGEPAAEELGLLGFGAALRTTLGWADAGLWPSIEIGFASGDSDPDDGRDTTFRFHPDYNVGLLLFEQVLARQSARAADRSAEAAEAGFRPAPEAVASEGSVYDAFYVQPAVRWRPLAGLDLRLAFLYALAPAGGLDPVAAALGGVEHNFAGGASRAATLGYEVDAGASYAFTVAGLATLRLGLEAGVLFAGAALQGAGAGRLDPAWTVRGSFAFAF